MAKKSTPTFDKWKNTFRGKTGKLRDAAQQAISEVMPNMTQTVTTGSAMARETRQYITKTRTYVKGQLRKVNRTSGDIMNDALHDLDTGNYSLSRFADSIYESTDDIDEMVRKMDETTPGGGDGHSTAIIGKAVVESNAATIHGLQQMANTMSSVNLKSTKAVMSTIKDVGMFQMNQTNTILHRVSQQINVLNSNLEALVRFNNETSLQVNNAALEFYNEADNKLYAMGEVLSSMKDFMEETRQTSKKNEAGIDPYDFRNGFDFGNYKDMVKKNFGNSYVGSMLDMGKMMLSMGGGGDPATAILSMIMKAVVPSQLKKSLGRADKHLTTGLNELLYRIGDMQGGGFGIKSIIGEIFGKKRPRFAKANLGDYKKDYMGWNGVAQRYLTDVIPSYLANIESALTKKESRYYNADTGMFMSTSQIEKSFQDGIQSAIEFNMGSMSDFTKKIQEQFDASHMSEGNQKQIKDMISNIVSDQVLGKSSKSTKENMHDVRTILERDAGISGNILRDIMVEFTDGMHQAQEAVNEFVHSMEDDLSGSVYRNLHNTKGKNTNYLYRGADLFKGSSFSLDGILMDDLFGDDLEEALKAKENEEKMKSMKKKGFFKKFFDRKKRGGKISHFVDNRTDDLYDILTGEFHRGNRNTTDVGGASSQATIDPPSGGGGGGSEREINEAITEVTSQTYDFALTRSANQLINQSKRVNRLIQDMKDDKPRASSQADPGSAKLVPNGASPQQENTNILKRLVLSLHTNFLQPMVGGLFGKDGFFRNIFNKEKMKEWKEKLFDEKDGVFGNVTSYIKDQFDYLKYVFTGKKYTNRQGKSFPENTNSVLDHLSSGWDFLYRNTMKYLFGENFESNETFQKYFQWLDWKGKRNKKREERLAKEEQEKEKASSTVAGGTNAEDFKSAKEQPSQLLLEDHKNKPLQSSVKRNTNWAFPALPDHTEPGKFELMTMEDTKQIREEVSTNLLIASQEAGALIVKSGETLSSALVGDLADESKGDALKKTAKDSLFKKFKEGLPKSLAFGLAGAGLGTYTMFHGAGLLGSLFLPGGPISGALLGIGISLATRSEGFMKFLFGEKDDDGKRLGGLVSKRTQEWTKKSMPIIVGGAMVGAAKSLFLGGVGNGLANGPAGFLLQSLLPGGIIGGAMLGLGISLFKNNEKVKEVLWGKDGGDGKKIGGILNKESSTLGKIFAKSGNFIKGGIKGLGVGLLTNATLGGAGVLGAAVTASGPIGLGLTGLGLGIASQTKKFQEVLFGTEEYDENGKFIGRRKDGLLTRASNMLRVGVFEPIRDKIEEKAVDFAYWAKEKIEYPFRLAFGPIVDSLKGIKQNIEDSIHDMFNNIGMTITDVVKAGFKKLFSPFTKVIKFAASALGTGVSLSLKAALSPISVPLKMLQFATFGKRFAANNERRGAQISHFGDIVSDLKRNWSNEDDAEKGYTGPFGGIKKLVGHAKDVKQGWDASTAAYNNEMKEQGFNSFGWMSVAQEKKDLKKRKKQWKNERRNEKNAWKFRTEILGEHNWNGDTEFTEDQIKDIQKRAKKFGYTKESLATSEDINQFLLHKNDWLDKWNPNKDKTSAEYQARHGMLMRESPEMAKARHDTKTYQEAVLEKFSGIEKAFTIYAAQNALKRRSNLKPDEVDNITKDLRSKGLSWDDVGFDPADLADVGSISNEDWDDLLKGMYESGDIQSYREWYRKKFVDKPSETASDNGSIPHVDGDIVDDDDESFRMWKSQSARYDSEPSSMAGIKPGKYDDVTVTQDENGNIIIEQNMDDLKEAIIHEAEILDDIRTATENEATFTEEANTERKAQAKFERKEKSSKERKDREAEESRKAKGLSLLGLGHSNDEEETGEAKLFDDENENEETDKDEKDSKKGGGFLKGVFGNLSSWLLSSSVWTKLGVGAVLMGLFGEQIIAIGETITGFLKDHVWPHVSTLLGTVWNGLQKHVPILMNKLSGFVVERMPQIIHNAVKIGWTAVTTLGKMAINALADMMHLPTPFKDVELGQTRDGDTTVYDSKEIAESAGINLDGDNVQINPDGTVTALTSGYGYDSDGNTVNVRGGATGYGMPEAGKLGYKMLTSQFTRDAGKKVGKNALKAAGWVTGIIPGTKLIKGVGKAGVAVGKGAYGAGKAIFKKGAKEVVEETGEAVIEKAGKNVAKEAGEATVKGAAKMAEQSVDIIGVDGKVLSTVQKGAREVTEEAGENIVKKGAKETGEKMMEKGLKNAAEDGIEKGIKNEAGSSIIGFLKKTKTKVNPKNMGDVGKHIPENKLCKIIHNAIDKLLKKVSGAGIPLLSKVSDWLAKKLGYTAGKAAIGLVPILNFAFATIDFIRGLVGAEELFGVENPTAGMRTVSAIMETLLGTSIGVWFDLIFSLAGFFGYNIKRDIARGIYSFISPSGEEKFAEADARMEIETKKYNKANNTNLSRNEYEELTRKKEGWFWNRKKVMSDEERNKYRATDEELKAYRNGTGSNTTSFDSDGTPEPTQKQINEYQGQDLLYGSKHKKAFSDKLHAKALSFGESYGGALTQGDPRWGNFELGKFADGTLSTMATGGCGPTALSMISSSLGGHKSPLDVAQYAKSNGYIQDGGSTSGLFTSGANAMGLNASTVNKSSMQDQLQSGSPMIIAGKSTSSDSPYTSAGHVIVANGVDRAGNAIVNNPMDQQQQHVPINQLKSGMTHAWTYSPNKKAGRIGYGLGPIGFGLGEGGYSKADDLYNGYVRYVKGNAEIEPVEEAQNSIEKHYQDLALEPLRRQQETAKNADINISGASDEYGDIASLGVKNLTSKDFIKIVEKAEIDAFLKKMDEQDKVLQPGKSMLRGMADRTNEKAFKALITKGKGYTAFREKYLQLEKASTYEGNIANVSTLLRQLYPGLTYRDASDAAKLLKHAMDRVINQVGPDSVSDAILQIQDKQLKTKMKESTDPTFSKLANTDIKRVRTWYKNIKDAGKAEFYNGHTVGELKLLERAYHISQDATVSPLFGAVYKHFVEGHRKFEDSYKITTNEILDLMNSSNLKLELGGDGETQVGDEMYQYRNGFPFFYTEDPRWNDLEWRDDRIGTRGSDIASIAAVTSAYGDFINDPRMIHRVWLQKYTEWGSVEKGIDEAKIFSDGGLNALETTQGHVVDPEDNTETKGRLQIERLYNKNSIVSALQGRVPVYLKGFRFPGSIFGGDKELPFDEPVEGSMYYEIDSRHAPEYEANMRANGASKDEIKKFRKAVNKRKKQSYAPESVGSAVALKATSTHFAVNNPYDPIGTPDIFDLDRLFGKFADGTSYVTDAWAIRGPHGKGINSKIDLSAKQSTLDIDHVDIANKKGITDKLSALFSNLASVFQHQASALVEGKDYSSIYDPNDTKVNEDAVGVGKQGSTTTTEAGFVDENTDSNGQQDASNQTGEAGLNLDGQTVEIDPTGASIEQPTPVGGGAIEQPIGSGFRDIPIAFGKKKTTTGSLFTYDAQHAGEAEVNEKYNKAEEKVRKKKRKKDKQLAKKSNSILGTEGSLTERLNAALGSVAYATQAEVAGTDYATAKSEYLANLHNDKNAGGSSDGSGSASGYNSGQTYPVVHAQNADLNSLTEEGILHTDLMEIPKPSPAQIRQAIVANWQRDGSVFKKGQEENDANGIYQAQTNTGLSAIIPFAIGALESGWGTSNIANSKGNLWGWGAVNSNPYGGAKSFNPNDMGSSFGLYSTALLEKYYKEYELKSIANIGSGGGNGNIAYAQDGHGGASTTWATNVASTGIRNVKAMREAKDTTVAGPGTAKWHFRPGRAIGFGGNWLNIVQQVKSQLANGQGYSQSAYTNVTIDGKTVRTRRDCSGFTSACCNFYGANIGMQTSGWFADRSHSVLEKAGFQSAPWPGWDQLKPGDIIARPGHVEIFAGNKGNGHYVYNVGSHKSANNPNATRSAKSSYTTIWRPAEAGSVANLFSNSLGAAADGSDGTESGSQGSSAVAQLSSPLDVPLASLGKTFETAFDGGNIIDNTFTVKGPGNQSHPMATLLGGKITSVYGSRKSSLGNEYHRGIDIAAERGKPIKSPVSGQVVGSGKDAAGYGNYTMIQDSKGYNHLFAHMNKPGIYGIGSIVNSNDVIGEVGMTGKTTGDHLHYEIRKSGNKYSTVNPFQYEYDDTGKDLNLFSQMSREPEYSVGSGDRDIPIVNRDPMNIDLNADGVESRLDSLIQIMSKMASKETSSTSSNTISQTNNTTNVYGSGKGKVTTKKKSGGSSPGKNEMAEILLKMHKEIASK